jgi:hypothetical protein
MSDGEFICPECGARHGATLFYVDPAWTFGQGKPSPANPWDFVLQRYTCAGCGWNVPAHLGARWEGRSVEAAKREWHECYRATARRKG